MGACKAGAESSAGLVLTNPGGEEPDMAPSELLAIVLKALNQSTLAGQSVPRMTETMTRFTAYIEKGHRIRSVAQIDERHVKGFVLASVPGGSDRRPPAIATMHLRRSGLRLYFRIARQEGVLTNDPTIDLYLPPRSNLSMRPLTSDEVALCRSHSLKSLTATRHPAALALAEATARTSEIPHIAISDVDLEGGRVWLHGSSKTEARWGYPSQWGLHQLARRVEALKAASGQDPRLVYRGSGSEQSRQAASCIAITETLERAGLAQEPDVRPLSIVAWAGRCIYSETGRIEEVARRTGMRSLDRAARLIGLQWMNHYEEESKGPLS